ncbi:UDP-N-acetylmuramate--L-alanine ligase [Catenulispora sp. NF23]|uniref:UDP-N-acetylmuramate--L-alanine ligase n=1 Tax=Catenulispora pinistramenti TaxID=2705254 RepID=A0ABS5KV89_9ACTN|nr:UDP-N-acetylmuramate--L-alanine ligase [Catenulispora pinistramenti]MBS2538293.1 UDP-N-acetylmuramate--L-alanine ligase [Catenulispora pinistramenti]MBS2549965.1 UDP-N-acetylmuramate--L-alanine ligase [Catenulispora pinistramenti]
MKRFPAPAEVIPAAELGRIHFVGIGGVGMAPLARAVIGRGLPVSGSEIKDSATVRELRDLGATIALGQAPENLDGVDTVVVSADIPEWNVEVVEAGARGLRLLHRASALASLMPGYRAVAIAGTHGKTTTSSMVAVALRHAGLDPSFVIGGEIGTTGESGHAGAGDILIAEADESDGTFTHYRPTVAVITNMELDHPDHFADVAQVHAEFQDFADRLEPGGTLVCFADDQAARAIAERTAARGVRVLTYGLGEDVDIRVTDVGTVGGFPTFKLVTATETHGPITLSIPARHNALNSGAALGVALALGVEPKPFLEGVAQFTGARRRMQFLGEVGGVKVYDSYGHHPTEIASDLSAARELVGEGRVIVAFQPHRYFRTNTFLHEFGPALGSADAAVVLDVYSHGEEPIPGVGGDVIAAETGLPPEASLFEPDFDRVPQRLAELAGPGDLVVTVGAGDVTEIGPRLLKLLA